MAVGETDRLSCLHLRALTLPSSLKSLWLCAAVVCCLLASCVSGQSQCTVQLGCFPPVDNLARGRTVIASSTCANGTMFCIPSQGCNSQFVCDPQSTHSSSNINDGNTGSLWISEIGSMDTVTLQLDFEAPVIFESMEVRWGTVRPHSMVLERSVDNGQTWHPYRYYSANCNSTFMLPETFDLQFNTTDAICTSAESRLNPASDGLVTFSTDQHISTSTSVEEATSYKLVTNIRLVLVSLFQEVIASGLEFQYYAISEWTVEGTCMCNGHASMCIPAVELGETINSEKVMYAGCMCQHATTGTHCDECSTGFNAAPWAPGTTTDSNACEECDCSGNALDCEYVASQDSAVCINCSVPTTGDHCDDCLPGFYQDLTELPSNEAFCKPCDCSAAGTIDPGVCGMLGQCECKANVDSGSQRCDTCQDGYWNISATNTDGCQECDCIPSGTTPVGNLHLCNKTTGVCECRENVVGERCDRCADGFTDLERGCVACDCNLAGSLSPVCDQNSPDGQCPCKPNINSIRCNTPDLGYSYKTLDDIRFEAEEADFTQGVEVVYVIDQTVPFTGLGFVSVSTLESVTFTVSVPRDYQYEIVIRYQADTDISVPVTITDIGTSSQDFNCNAGRSNLVPRLAPRILSPFVDYEVVETLCLSNTSQYQVTIDYTGNDDWLLDSVVLLPDFAALSAFYAAQVTQTPFITDCIPYSASTNEEFRALCDIPITFSLSVEFYGQVFACDCSETGSLDSICDPHGGVCSCREGVGGDTCSFCANTFFNFSSGCQACACDEEGSTSQVCDFETGQCSCRDGAGATRTCSDCLPGFFNLTDDGCSPCDCSEFSISPECDSLGQCQCPTGVNNLKCDQCLDEYYNISQTGCQECDCNRVSSLSTICEVTTGQCPCIGDAVGRDCSLCPENYFTTDGISRDYCVMCACTGQAQVCTVDNTTHALGAFQSDFVELCTYSPTNCSDGWELQTADGQMATPFGPSTASGLGYILLDNNLPQLHAPDHFLGDRQAAYGLNFVVDLTISDGTDNLHEDSTFVRITGSFLNETLVATFPNPTLMSDGFAVENIVRYSVPFMEGYWHLGAPSGPLATAMQIFSVLADLTELSFTAEFTEVLIEFVQVRSITLYVAVPLEQLDTFPGVIIRSSFPVESCVCPEGYSGQSCQECARGYVRASGNPAEPCTACSCNGLALDCESATGTCINCTGNSTGDNCERCQVGFFGDPTRGIPCLPCECPTIDRSFSATCSLDISTNGSVCDDCALGYTGQHCELCSDGYFGNPLVGNCITCECNGNIDPALGPVCDMTSGLCLNCQNNTEGFNCEVCQPGFFGDPTLNIPCRPCDCHENGTDGDCDRLDGRCACLPNALGSRCDQCEPDFWGLNLGPGCIPCDCCTNGSLSSSCDQDTGRCNCLSNVGSDLDDKCCMCSPGFFNLSPDVGCEACNCSALSVSPACDQGTGQCLCQDGAIGLKCDDCDFGYFGRVPDCQRCHECFFQWHEIIDNALNDVRSLQSFVNALITDNYNGYDVSGIESEVTALLQQIAAANDSLGAITLQSGDVEELEQSLSQLTAELEELMGTVTEIEQQLSTSAEIVDTANGFDGSVDDIIASDIQREALYYNTTIANLATNASNQVKQLMQEQAEAIDAWVEADILQTMVEVLLLNLSQSVNNTQVASSILEQFQEDFYALMASLASLDVSARTLSNDLQELFQSAMNVSGDLQSANSSVQTLIAEAEDRRMQANTTYELARQLNTSVEVTWTAALNTMESASKLLNQSVTVNATATALLEDIISRIMDVSALSQTLAATKSLAQEVINISLPSVESVTELARQINESVISDDLIQGILENATNSRIIAQMALNTAETASNAVNATWELIQEIVSDINRTRSTLTDVESTIDRLQLLINQTWGDLTEIEETSGQVAETLLEVRQIHNEVCAITEMADLVGMENRERASALLRQARTDADTAQELQQGLEDLWTNVSAKGEQVNTIHTDAVSNLDAVNELLSDAEQLNSAANSVSLQELNDLLDEYISETEELNSLEAEEWKLRQELEDLTQSLMQASDRLNACYKTP